MENTIRIVINKKNWLDAIVEDVTEAEKALAESKFNDYMDYIKDSFNDHYSGYSIDLEIQGEYSTESLSQYFEVINKDLVELEICRKEEEIAENKPTVKKVKADVMPVCPYCESKSVKKVKETKIGGLYSCACGNRFQK